MINLAPVTIARAIEGPNDGLLRVNVLDRNCNGMSDPLAGMNASIAHTPARTRTETKEIEAIEHSGEVCFYIRGRRGRTCSTTFRYLVRGF